MYYDSSKSSEIIWAGTYGGGLNKIDLTEADTLLISIEKYTIADGLADNVVYGIQGDKQKNIWMSTNNGISMLNITTNQFRNFNMSDGVQGKQFYWGASYKNRNGKIYFGGVNGFNVFNPDSLFKQKKSPTIKIVDFKIFNKSVPVGIYEDRNILSKTISETKKINLSHKDYVFTIEYAALNFQSPTTNKYAYIMEGAENDWHFVDNRRFVTYANLQPGNYTFKVKSVQSLEKMDGNIATLQIEILPPFYQTWLFRVSFIIAILLIIAYAFRLRVRSIQLSKRKLEIEVQKRTKELSLEIAERKRIEASLCKSEEELQQSNASKDKFFSIIAHDLKNPINISIGFSQLLLKKYKSINDEKKLSFIEAIHKASYSIYNLLENLLEWSLAQTKGLKKQPRNLKLDELLLQNIELAKTLAMKKNISIEKSLSENLSVFCDKHMIDTVFRNLLNNAVKFTPQNGSITVKTSKENNCACIEIIDTGVGIDVEKINDLFSLDKSVSTKGTDGESGTGLGLVLCKEFVEDNNGNISISSKFKEGTCIKVYLPLSD